MTIGLVGCKCGMTRVFTEAGNSVPVSVIEIDPNRVTQIKTTGKDGYSAIQVTTGARRVSRVTKPAAGVYAKANVEAGRGLWEFRVASDSDVNVAVGDSISVDMFEAGQKIDVSGVSKGKGFAGVVKS